jgi:hypothetical protein
MCRNIKTLYNFEPPATEEEVRDAAVQYVRKISGFRKPSALNMKAFERAVEEIAKSSMSLMMGLETNANPKNREEVAAKARERNKRRFETK